MIVAWMIGEIVGWLSSKALQSECRLIGSGALIATVLPGRRFPVAIAQRADIVLRMPPDGSAVPILALGEGRRLRSGVILQPPGAQVAKMSASTNEMGQTSANSTSAVPRSSRCRQFNAGFVAEPLPPGT